MDESANLLFEVGTEELPPKTLFSNSQALSEIIAQNISMHDLAFEGISSYCTPRRLAFVIRNLSFQQKDQNIQKKGPSLDISYDQEGRPTKAALGFAKSCGTTLAQLSVREHDGANCLFYSKVEKGKSATTLIPKVIEQSLKDLPVARRMRWGDNQVEFLRPVHWVVLLHGKNVIKANILGIDSNNISFGHRFHAPKKILLKNADDYINLLEKKGKVIVSFEKRKKLIIDQTKRLAKELDGVIELQPELLDEITSMVEWPCCLVGKFDKKFLQLPEEVLVYTMQDKQKYFPVKKDSGSLMSFFIFVSNIEAKNPGSIVSGNERVIKPRFHDAEFFLSQDKKTTLASRYDSLEGLSFHRQLGNVQNKSKRVTLLAKLIANEISADEKIVMRACELYKCDLLTEMVSEFPGLQGIMGSYYALQDGENEAVATAIREHYLPKQAGDELPSTLPGKSLALAERIDSLVGIFSAEGKPSGIRDPFGLRRASIGLLRIIIECEYDLDLKKLLSFSASLYPKNLKPEKSCKNIIIYILDRLQFYYAELGISKDVIDSVIVCQSSNLLEIDRKIRAVSDFKKLRESVSLTAAGKRIRNILKTAEIHASIKIDQSLLAEKQEKDLFNLLEKLEPEINALSSEDKYPEALKKLSTLKTPVDAFFDNVMVMDKNEKLRRNRIALLHKLNELFLKIADFSKLQ